MNTWDNKSLSLYPSPPSSLSKINFQEKKQLENNEKKRETITSGAPNLPWVIQKASRRKLNIPDFHP